MPWKWMRQVATQALLALAAILFSSGAAEAGTRVALVIGNAQYDHAPVLATPVADAGTVASALRGIGFVVNVQTDLTNAALRNALSEFARTATGADTAIIYFAGYGIGVDGQNYLLPTDASLESRASLIGTVPADALYRAVDGASGQKFVILDAARPAPFAAALGGDHGLSAPVQMTRDLTVIYAAQPGTLARDGSGANSALALALARELPAAAQNLALAVAAIRENVRTATGGGQEPAIFGAAAMQMAAPDNGNVYHDNSNGPPDSAPVDRDLTMWTAMGAAPDKTQLQTYLALFPNGAHAADARARLLVPEHGHAYNPHPHVNDPYAGLPSFPWPPPPPSEKMVLPRGKLLAGLGAQPSLSAIGQKLTQTLVSAGYPEYSFYRAPDGFAVVARLEQITSDGAPQPQGERFLDPNAQQQFSLSAYLAHLFYAPQGFYRLIVFVVTPQIVAPRGAAPKAEKMQSLLANGATKLPAVYNNQTFTADHDVTALVYEFRKSGKTGVLALTPGRLDARTHLEKAGLYARLMNGGR